MVRPHSSEHQGNLQQVLEQIVSYDKMGFFRPWHNPRLGKPSGYITKSGWYHVDLDARADTNHKQAYPYQESAPREQPAAREESPDRCHALQGLLSLYDQNETTGGLVLFPGSHNMFFEDVLPIIKRSEDDADEDDLHEDPEFMRLLQNYPLRPKLVQAKAGDFIIWDSRTVHADTPALRHPQTPEDRLLRAVAYVAMAPASWASEAVRDYRRSSYERRQCTRTGHMPHFPELNFEKDDQLFAAALKSACKVKRPLSEASAEVQALVDPWYASLR